MEVFKVYGTSIVFMKLKEKRLDIKIPCFTIYQNKFCYWKSRKQIVQNSVSISYLLG